MTKYILGQQSTNPPTVLPNLSFDPFAMVFCGLVAVAGWTMLSKPKSSNKQGKSYWGGAAQLATARRIAYRQIPAFSGKEIYTKASACSLYIGTPDRIYYRHQCQLFRRLKPELAQIEAEYGEAKRKEVEAKYRPTRRREKCTTLYLPDMQRGTAIFGASGSGKSYGILNPMIRSAVDQNITCTVYDFKYPEQTKEIAGYAAQRGYKLQIFAPSFAESGTFNFFDFIRDSGDSVGSGQIAEVLTENTSKGGGKDGNEFFESGGASTLSSGMLMTKWLEEDSEAIAIARRLWRVEAGASNPVVADVLTCAAILNLPGFAERIKFAVKRLNPWIIQTLAQFLSAGGGSEPGGAEQMNVTQAGIIANAQKTIGQLVKRDFIPALCGKSTIEIDLNGANTKTLTIVGLNQDYRHLITPLLATCLDLLISRNVAHSRYRTVPFFVSIDELPSMKLKKIANWLAEARSAGLCMAIALQNKSQLNEAYGEDRANTIVSNCATKHYLNPQDPDSAKSYSEYLGEQEIRYFTTSTSYQKGGGSRSRTENISKVPLMEPAEFLKMGEGRVVTISPGYRNPARKETYLPILHDITISERDRAESKKSEAAWEAILAQFKDVKIDEAQISREFELRVKLVEQLFPLPPKSKFQCQLSSLVSALRENGYSDANFTIENQEIDLNREVVLPSTWMSEGVFLLPTDTPQGLSDMVILVTSCGYKIVRTNLVKTFMKMKEESSDE